MGATSRKQGEAPVGGVLLAERAAVQALEPNKYRVVLEGGTRVAVFLLTHRAARELAAGLRGLLEGGDPAPTAREGRGEAEPGGRRGGEAGDAGRP